MRKWLVVLGLYALVALLAAAGLVAGGYAQQQDGLEFRPPSSDSWFGTDHLGRDVFARTLHGARIALTVGALAAGIAVAIGAALGLVAGWFRGWVDETSVWLSGAVAAIPGILLVLAIAAMLGRGFTAVFVAVGLATWVDVFRLVRAETLRLREREFVLAARAAGAGHARVLGRHLLPNLAPLLLVQFTLRFVYAVKLEVIVSFLGVGLSLDEPSWGAMIEHATQDLPQGRWWPLAAATLAMFGLILAVQRLGDHLRDRLDPYERGAAGSQPVSAANA